MIRLITCNNLQDAYLIKGNLANEGIESIIINKNFSSLVPMYNNMLGGGIQVQVLEEDYEKARLVIIEELEPDNNALVCPHCGSKNIKLTFGKRKYQKWISIIIAVLSFTPFGNIKLDYYCKDCQSFIK